MPQRISDDSIAWALKRKSSAFNAWALDLRDARAEIKALFNECVQRRTCYEELEEALKIAVEALEYYAIGIRGMGTPTHKAKAALDRIKGIG